MKTTFHWKRSKSEKSNRSNCKKKKRRKKLKKQKERKQQKSKLKVRNLERRPFKSPVKTFMSTRNQKNANRPKQHWEFWQNKAKNQRNDRFWFTIFIILILLLLNENKFWWPFRKNNAIINNSFSIFARIIKQRYKKGISTATNQQLKAAISEAKTYFYEKCRIINRWETIKQSFYFIKT